MILYRTGRSILRDSLSDLPVAVRCTQVGKWLFTAHKHSHARNGAKGVRDSKLSLAFSTSDSINNDQDGPNTFNPPL